MRSNPQSTRAEADVHGFVAGVLQRHLAPKDYGRTCSAAVLIAVWLFAASTRLSLSAAAERLRFAPSDETIRKATRSQLPSLPALERRLNAALCDHLPRSLRKRRSIWAVDLTEQPYYGKSRGIGRQLRHGKPKRGATKFRVFASLYVVHRGERFTLAVTYVWRDDTLPSVLARLLDPVRKRGVSPKFLLLDRQFYNLDTVRFLQRRRIPFLMPVVHRGRRARNPDKVRGTQRFLSCKRSCRRPYVMRNKERIANVTVLAAVDQSVRKKRRGGRPRSGRRVLVFAAWGFDVRSPAWARETYRRRFGIETSYRQAHQAQAWTTSRDCKLRLLLMGLALLLRNAWVGLHRRLVSRELPRGAFLMRPERLRLATLLIHLAHEILLLYGLTELALP